VKNVAREKLLSEELTRPNAIESIVVQLPLERRELALTEPTGLLSFAKKRVSRCRVFEALCMLIRNDHMLLLTREESFRKSVFGRG
jgi:hypothetical protein